MINLQKHILQLRLRRLNSPFESIRVHYKLRENHFGKENDSMSMNIYIGNLSTDVAETGLENLFARYGQVEGVKIITDRFSGISRGFGFVGMSNRNEGHEAIKELNDKEFQGRNIKVSEARPRQKRQNARPQGGRGRSYY
jgi:RNA recognition motif-containing protein